MKFQLIINYINKKILKFKKLQTTPTNNPDIPFQYNKLFNNIEIIIIVEKKLKKLKNYVKI